MKILRCNDYNELSSKSYCKLNGGTVTLSGVNLMPLLLTHIGAHEKTLCDIYTTVMMIMRSENIFYYNKEAHYPS